MAKYKRKFKYTLEGKAVMHADSKTEANALYKKPGVEYVVQKSKREWTSDTEITEKQPKGTRLNIEIVE